MRNESLIHFHYEQNISVGIHLRYHGDETIELIERATHFLDQKYPGRCVAGFCAMHNHLIETITKPPPEDWHLWRQIEWDQWFGRLHGVFLVDMKYLQIAHYPLYRSAPITRKADFSALEGRLRLVDGYGTA